MKRYQYLFFDLDRTLYDFEACASQTLRELYDTYSLHNYFCDFEEFHAAYRKNNEMLWGQYRYKLITKDCLRWMRFQMTLAEKDIFDIELAEKLGNDYISQSPMKCILFPETIEVLNALHLKYSLYLITNGFKEVQYQKIDNCGLRKYFKDIFTSEEIGYNKPEKAYFEEVMLRSCAHPIESLVIGDDIEVDIQGANTMDIDTVWFNHFKKPATRPVTYQIGKLSDLLTIL